MTPMQIFELALAQTAQSTEDAQEIQKYFAAWLNLLLCESFTVENNIRKKNLQPQLTQPPYITAADFEKPLCYSHQLCSIALPYGLCACIFAEDDNDYRAADYRARYINALNEADKADVTKILNVYG